MKDKDPHAQALDQIAGQARQLAAQAAELQRAVERLAAPPESRLMTVPEAAAWLGVSRTTLYTLHKAGQLRFVKIGASTRVDRADAEALADSLRADAR
ncbi:MAG: helix-turn-helix domain-containing protein [Propionibacteriaceae bacterium]|jgi:excisionase family DNA binding protein|nr:helix-turn-helix domain-containing protein [Propionibacteriaceae bacterium]